MTTKTNGGITDAAIAQAFREYDEGDIVQMRTILARARELDAEKGGEASAILGEICTPAEAEAARNWARNVLYGTPPTQAAEAVVERVAEALAYFHHDCSIAELQHACKWGRVDDCRAQARAAIAAMQAGEG